MKISTLQQLESFLKLRIPTREALFVGDIGLKRAKYFMKLLGNPQNKLKVIHIAGTSGKGSTAHLASAVMLSQGFSVGLSISPHVFDVRERMQINNQLPDKQLVLKYFNQILPTILKMENCKYGMPTFFEINVALAFFMFAAEKLHYAVIETGLGGRLDATNTVSRKNKICILTKIGLDHTEILGKTITKIAAEKAGVVQTGNTVISASQAAVAAATIRKHCEEKNASLHQINEKNYSIISSTPQETTFNFTISPKLPKESWYQNVTTASKWYQLDNIKLGLIGLHQAENCSLALACLVILSKRDNFKIDEASLRAALKKIAIPGRLEIRKMNKKVLIIDGAHNPQKMEALTSNLAKMYPKQKFAFIVAFKKGKDYKNILKYIIPLADKILLTQFSTSRIDNHYDSIDNQEISEVLKSQKFKNFSITSNKNCDIIKNIRTSKKSVVITGSLYFIGSIYPYLKK